MAQKSGVYDGLLVQPGSAFVTTATIPTPPATGQAVVTVGGTQPIPVAGQVCTMLGGTTETMTVLSVSGLSVTMTANFAQTGHTSMTFGYVLNTQVIVNSGAAIIPGSPAGPRQQLHNTWLSAVLSGTGTFYIDWNGGTPQIITSTGTNLPLPAAGYMRLASFTQTAGVVSSVVDLRASATYGNTLFTLTGSTDKGHKRPYLITPPGWDDAYQRAKANSATTPTWIAWIGASSLAGLNSYDSPANSVPGQVRAALIAAGYPVYAEYWNTGYSSPLVKNGSMTSYVPWTLSGGNAFATTGFQGVGTRFFPGLGGYISNATTASFVFTSRSGCTSMEILGYDPPNTATWGYTVDSGTQQIVTNGNTLWQRKISGGVLSGLTAGVHTITIAANAGGSPAAAGLAIAGANAYYGTTGIGHGFFALSGGQAALTISADQAIRQWMGQTSNNGPQTFGFPYGPSLVVIELIGDDLLNQRFGPSGIMHAGYRLIQACRALYANCSVLLMATDLPNYLTSDNRTLTAAAPGGLVYQYADAYFRLAQITGSAYFNYGMKWGEDPLSLTYVGTSNPHPHDFGYHDLGNTITSLLV